jgi:EcoRII C terminal/Restriction endonuclease EcoRII, N-terminal
MWSQPQSRSSRRTSSQWSFDVASKPADLSDWLTRLQKPEALWYLKRLSGNDTLATGAHQAGPYVPKEILFEAFPELNRPGKLNPDITFDVTVDSHGVRHQVRAVWYNNRLFGRTRNEARITQWGGSSSPLLDPDNTGALTVFVFSRSGEPRLRVWVCETAADEDLVEATVEPIEPGMPLIWRPDRQTVLFPAGVRGPATGDCRLRSDSVPPGWLQAFPSGQEILDRVVTLRPLTGEPPDERLVRRRACEFEMFQSLEEIVEGPRIAAGFPGVSDFLSHAQRILQRRKARSGKSLELQTRAILLEEGLLERSEFSHQPESDPGKRPDFLFPSETAYKDPRFPAGRLRMLAVKTTCRDRWRQILNEADRITAKHLLTLQEGVSENQFAEMRAAGVQLVVPSPLTSQFPAAVRPHLLTLTAFIAEVGNLRPN